MAAGAGGSRLRIVLAALAIVALGAFGVVVRSTVRSSRVATARVAATAALARHACDGYREAAGLLGPAAHDEGAAVDQAFALALLASDCADAAAAGPAMKLLSPIEQRGPLAGRAAAARGLLHLANGQPGSAILSVGHALEQDPRSPELLLVRARIERASGQLANARESLNLALGEDPALLPARIELGEVLSADHPQAAQEAFEQALVAAPLHPRAILGLARLAAAGRIAGPALIPPVRAALPLLAEQKDPEECRAAVALARLVATTAPAEATAAEEQARAAGARDPPCLLELSRQLLRRARLPAAAAALRDAAALPASTPTAAIRQEAARAALLAEAPEVALLLLEVDPAAPEAGLAKLHKVPGAAAAFGLAAEAHSARAAPAAGAGAEAPSPRSAPAAGAAARRGLALSRSDPDARRGHAAVALAAGDAAGAALALEPLLRIANAPATQRLLAATLALRVAVAPRAAARRASLLAHAGDACLAVASAADDALALRCAATAKELAGDAPRAAELRQLAARQNPELSGVAAPAPPGASP